MICAQCSESVPGNAGTCPSCAQPPLLDQRYRLLEIVGHGANGTTYRAERLSDGAVVAIKELMVRKVESLKALELFERECAVLRQLDHSGVPDFHDELSVESGRSVSLYLVQEFIDGRTLAAELEDRRLSPQDAFEIAAEVLDTLDYLHGLSPPVVHRDIKPSNIMRRAADGELVLIDFGSVRAATDTKEGGSTVAGTFGYMAPEQFMGRALPATDVYGVGAMLVALLSRRDPQELSGTDRQLEWRGAFSLPPTLGAILDQMLELEVEKRPSDAAAVAAAIRAALRGERPELPGHGEPLTDVLADILSKTGAGLRVAGEVAEAVQRAQGRNPRGPRSGFAKGVDVASVVVEALQQGGTPSEMAQRIETALARRSDGAMVRKFVSEVVPGPRPLPKDIKTFHSPSARFAVPFGAAFTFAGVGTFAICVIVAFAVGTLFPLIQGVLMGAIFSGIGIPFMVKGLREKKRIRLAYEHGLPAQAVIREISDANYQINSRTPKVIHYMFDFEGAQHEGEYQTLENLDLVEGDEVTVLHVAEEPSNNLLYDPAQYKMR